MKQSRGTHLFPYNSVWVLFILVIWKPIMPLIKQQIKVVTQMIYRNHEIISFQKGNKNLTCN